MNYLWVGDYLKAKTLLKEALEIKEKCYGTRDNIKVANTLRWLSTAHLNLGDYKESRSMLESALSIQEKYYGTRNAIDVAITLRRLAKAYLHSGYFQKAKKMTEETLAIYESHFPNSEHIDIGFLLKDLGRIYVYNKEYEKARNLLERALVIQKQYYGVENHMEYAFIWRELAIAYLNLGEPNTAKKLLEDALKIRTDYYGLNHPEIADILYAQAILEYTLKNEQTALSLVDQVINILNNYNGLHPDNVYLKNAMEFRQEILKDNKMKYKILGHWGETLFALGESGNFKVMRGENDALITGFNQAGYNFINFGSLDSNIILDLKKRKIPFCCMPKENIEHDFENFVKIYGLKKGGELNAMIYSDLKTFTYTTTGALKIKKVITIHDLQVLDKVLSIAFDDKEGTLFELYKSNLTNPDIHLFIAFFGDSAVGGGIISTVNKMGGLVWGGILPEYRNRGFATELTRYRMNFLKQLGYNSVYAQTGETSTGYYERIGFKSLGSLPFYCSK